MFLYLSYNICASARMDSLVNVLAVEWNADRGEQHACVSIVSGSGVDDNMETRNHLRRVPVVDLVSIFSRCILAITLSEQTYMS